MKTVTTVTEWLSGDAVPARAWQSLWDRQISVCRRCRGAIAIAERA
jgi:hypothetical protein